MAPPGDLTRSATLIVNWLVLFAYAIGGFVAFGGADGILNSPLPSIIYAIGWLAGAVLGTVFINRASYGTAVLVGMGGPVLGLATAAAII